MPALRRVRAARRRRRAGQHRRDDDHRPRRVGNARRRSRGAAAVSGPTARTTARWTHAIARSLAGSNTSSAASELHGRRTARLPGVGDRRGEQEPGQERDRAEVEAGCMAQEGAPGANPHAGPIRQVLFEIAAPAVHEVVAHVGRTITGRAIRRSPGARFQSPSTPRGSDLRRSPGPALRPPVAARPGSGSPCVRRRPRDRAAAPARPG